MINAGGREQHNWSTIQGQQRERERGRRRRRRRRRRRIRARRLGLGRGRGVLSAAHTQSPDCFDSEPNEA